MKKKALAISVALSLATLISTPGAHADAAKPGQSMTHIKTVAGLTEKLESVGVILYVQGGATAAVIGDSIATPTSQIVFHIPVTATKAGVEHLGSTIAFFNTVNNKVVQLRNPVIDLKAGVIRAVVPQAGTTAIPVLTIANAAELKAKVTNDRKAKLRKTLYAGATLNLAPQIGTTLNSALGLADGTIAEGATFATADVSLYTAIK